MEHVVEAVGLPLGEFGFRLVERFQFARKWLLGRRGQDDPAILGTYLYFVAVTYGDLVPDALWKGRIASACRRERGLWTPHAPSLPGR